MYKFIDLHCDTITTAYDKKEQLSQNNLDIDIKRLKNFKATQVFAIWLNKKYLKNAFENANKMIDFFDEQILKNQKDIEKITSFKNDVENEKIGAMLSLEGADCIENNLDNIEHFYKRGVRIMSLCWNGENALAYGSNEDEKMPLKDFGKKAIKYINKKDIILDVSHLNERGFWDLVDLVEKPFIATHSNAYEICKNKRNLKDEQLKVIKDINGLVGLNLYPPFLTQNSIATIDDILKHIDYMLNILGEDCIALGCDFDGIDKTPMGIDDILGVEKIINIVEQKFGKEISKKIAYKNALNFFNKNLC